MCVSIGRHAEGEAESDGGEEHLNADEEVLVSGGKSSLTFKILTLVCKRKTAQLFYVLSLHELTKI